jgi:hypothetical protein
VGQGQFNLERGDLPLPGSNGKRGFMTALIVGGDYINPLRKIITGKGVRRIEHWDGRKPGDLRKIVPKDTRLVVLLCDYLNHCLAKKVREDAERLGLPVIYCRRSLGDFCEKLDACIESGVFAITAEANLAACKKCSAKCSDSVS